MPRKLQLEMMAQPDDTTCGPTCLHAVYRFFGDDLPLEQVVREAPMLDQGGTLGAYLGDHALRRGYRVTMYTYNLKVFDPTWFVKGKATKSHLTKKLQAQIQAKESPKLQAACRAYIEFVRLGGKIRMLDLNASLIRRYLKRSIPILTGLSSTYLYQAAREYGSDSVVDDVRGLPAGHFVVLCGYDKSRRTVQVADPYLPNPIGSKHHYEVTTDRLVCSILMGVLTYDANLLVIEPGKQTKQALDRTPRSS
jgi:hypothetical protein